jgi:hypothetical protein
MFMQACRRRLVDRGRPEKGECTVLRALEGVSFRSPSCAGVIVQSLRAGAFRGHHSLAACLPAGRTECLGSPLPCSTTGGRLLSSAVGAAAAFSSRTVA